MKGFFKYVLATITGMLILSFLSSFLMFAFIGIISASSNKPTEIKEHSILYLRLDKEIVDRASDNPLDNLSFTALGAGSKLGLNQIIKSIDKAAKDDNIEGIFLELSHVPAGFASVEEIRDALLAFKDSSKFIYTYSDVLSQNAYYLASASDKIYLNPAGEMVFKGLRSRIPFFTKALDKIGVEPIIFRHGKFKSAIEPYTRENMSEANKEQSITYINSIWNHVVDGISEQRGLSQSKLHELADVYAARTPQAAVQNGLIDGVKYRDEVIDELAELCQTQKSEKLQLVSLNKYKGVTLEKKHKPAKDKIALIYAEGEIAYGKAQTGGIGSETTAQALREARRDSSVKAIVFRVNSPGGSALASDIIWREALLCKNVKPLIVSMGDYAASGGYYIACAADKIIASEVTLTGSIGVFGVMMNTEKLMNDKLGITFDGVKTNELADFPDPTRSMSEAEKEIYQGSIEAIYDDFISKVGQGRSMTKENVDAIGQGRVWSGENAKEIGLVDEFGGLKTAITAAQEMAGLEKYRLVEYPKQASPMEELLKDLGAEVKVRLLKQELGTAYSTYKELQSLQSWEGVQARIPLIEIY